MYVGGERRLESHFYALAERIRKLGAMAEMLDKSAEEEDVPVEACAKLFGIALAIVPAAKRRCGVLSMLAGLRVRGSG